MEDKLKKLEDEVALIKDRNCRVETDKAWETSFVRIFSIVVITYIFASTGLFFIGVENFSISAIIPTLGFFLSTLSLPFIKKWWVSRFLK